MRQIILSVILFTLSLPVIGQIAAVEFILPAAKADTTPNYTGVVYDAYPNGMPKAWKTYRNGEASGKWVEWYPDGTLRFRSDWVAGKGHGQWFYYYPDGQVRDETYYEMDIAQGVSRSYHPNGQLAEETPYLNGKREGVVRAYSIDGVPLSQQRYTEDIAVLEKPILFEPNKVATTTNNEWDLAFTPSGDTLYFYRRQPGAKNGSIMLSVRKQGKWGEPSPVAFLAANEIGISISKDGRRLFTTNYNPLPGQSAGNDYDANIWFRKQENGSWSAPVSAGPTVNNKMEKEQNWPTNYETNPSTDAAGNLYFSGPGQAENDTDIYRANLLANGTYAKAIRLPEAVNSSSYDGSPVISPAGNYLIFASYNRGDGYGFEDLYYSKKTDTGWSTAVNLGPLVNSSGNEGAPQFSPDGKYFFFSSDRDGMVGSDGEKIWSIYQMEAQFLPVGN